VKNHDTFISKGFLKSHWALDYKAYTDEDDAALLETLSLWGKRDDLKETSAEAPFIETFFKTIWEYEHTGQVSGEKGYNLYPQFPVTGAGQKGGTGQADLAIGWFKREGIPDTPQIMCEFKDIKSNLDAQQKRKGNSRSPVKQCLDYLSGARRNMVGNETVLPTWSIVTDMNEFRLYWFDRAPAQYLSFVIRPATLFDDKGLLDTTEDARFDRFLFQKIFHKDTLLTTGGTSRLARLIGHQWVEEQKLEKTFYGEYREYRHRLYLALLQSNPNFPGTKGRLVRLAQKILDRCIFIFFCEDMGLAIKYPPQLLRDLLIEQSKLSTYNPKGNNIWSLMQDLFSAMNTGAAFGEHEINQFNGGLFAEDAELNALKIPNQLFCQKGQGHNSASLYTYKTTLLYMSAAYNYASDLAKGLTAPKLDEGGDEALANKTNPANSLSLYTLGRIFEQSITELEILEAEADGKQSLNKLNKRKTDGVYYTPEWVVERIVDETIGSRLAEMKEEAGWPKKGLPDLKVLKAYETKLEGIKVLDPACGSGAFLITALKYLILEWRNTQSLRQQLSKNIKKAAIDKSDDERIRSILQQNLYGVDINPASVEITRLALWLHTARSDKPLSSLDANIRCGNSLIGSDFYKGQVDLNLYDEVEKERVNAFDWETEYPEVFSDKNGLSGFDAVIGNPPYVKFQNFHKIHPDMTEYLRHGRDDPDGKLFKGYKSAKSGNFDLFIPFIEKGIELLNSEGRLGYIAPNVWVVNDYGRDLRSLLKSNGRLTGWVDFKGHQIFDEATIYTSLQFYSSAKHEEINILIAPSGEIPLSIWSDNLSLDTKDVDFDNKWLMLSGDERKLIDKLAKRCLKLSDPALTEAIFQGLITSADDIYHLKRLGTNRYLCRPKGKNAPPAYEVSIEDEIMKPLVSGPEAKRYVSPTYSNHLIFPYEKNDGKMKLISSEKLAKNYPNVWRYLATYKNRLSKREAALDKEGEFKLGENGLPEKAPFNDGKWYRFGRTQNLDKQELAKLVVAQTVTEMRVYSDSDGGDYLNNVRVNGILASKPSLLNYLMGILNSPVCNFVFVRTSKPKDNGYYEANKQFIAPLPIPKVTKKQANSVAIKAQNLQNLYTNRRSIITSLERRISATPRQERSPKFLFPFLIGQEELLEKASKVLTYGEKNRWAKAEYKAQVEAEYDKITERLYPDCVIESKFEGGELSLKIDDISVLGGIFLNDSDGKFIAAQWNVVGSTLSITAKTTGKKLCNELRKLVVTDNQALIDQITEYQEQLAEVETEIIERETEINTEIYKLYKLTDAEIAMVEAG